MKNTESQKSWFDRAKAEANIGVSNSDRFTGIVLVVVSVLLALYFVAHQTGSTGFFTPKFGALELFMLYGSLAAWITTGSLDGILGQRLLSRLFDVFFGLIFLTISLVWLLVIFPFNFVYFADVLPDFLRFILQWISDDIARGIMVLGIILLAVAEIYSPIAYKFVNIKRSTSKND